MANDEKKPITSELIREAVSLAEKSAETSKRYSVEVCVGQCFTTNEKRVIVNIYDMMEMRYNLAYYAHCYDFDALAEAIDKIREFIKKDGESA